MTAAERLIEEYKRGDLNDLTSQRGEPTSSGPRDEALTHNGVPPINPNRDRGSRKHILDLVSSRNFVSTVNRLFSDTDIRLAEPSYPRPYGRATPADWREYEIEEYMRALPFPENKTLDLKWWFPNKTGLNRRPTWDLLCQLDVGGRPGLLLVEAKAHVREMLEQDKKRDPTLSDESKANDRQIKSNIMRTNKVLSDLGAGRFLLSADNHYQLANRIAYLCKLANDGIPVVLLYLGWLNSPAWPRDCFRDQAHWQQVMHKYMAGVVPASFPERLFKFHDRGSMQMLIRSADARMAHAN
ncbi:MAG TPA: hypothetical protein VND64_03610 [Pirellulales bacterium]|nr:hypothetical protein [Pirellulales bacterium]